MYYTPPQLNAVITLMQEINIRTKQCVSGQETLSKYSLTVFEVADAHLQILATEW